MHGSEEATQDLYNYCKESDNVTNDLHAPKLGEVIDVSTARSMFRCRISDALFASLRFVRKGEYEIAYMQGTLNVNLDNDENTSKAGKLNNINQSNL